MARMRCEEEASADAEDRSKIFPTAISTGGDIGLSNLSLKTITLSLYSQFSFNSQVAGVELNGRPI
jgi:hypothetical protein